jgi:DNA-binding NarL/FixJ family response regulator
MKETLTTEEKTVLTMLGKGLYQNEIAKKLKLSNYTVSKQIKSAVKKLNARNSVHAIYLYFSSTSLI